MDEIPTAVLASGRGSTFTALLEYWRTGQVRTRPVLLISNKTDAEVVQRARTEGVPVVYISKQTHPNDIERDYVMLDALCEAKVNLVLSLGYLGKIGEAVLRHFPQRVLNIHPSLLPQYGGRGMHGLRVHQAVIDAGEKVTGATIHEVTAEYDEGPIIASCEVNVEPDDSASTLAARVLKAEHRLLRDTLNRRHTSTTF